jgi:monoamine oxidase
VKEEEYRDVVKETQEIADSYKEEEERPTATEDEQKDFEEYNKEVKKQKQQIDSYESLLVAKERGEKQKDIDKWLKKLSEKCNQLRSQEYKDPTIRDRLGKRSDFYREIWENMHFNKDSFLGGDLDKQHKLIKTLGSREADETPVGKIKQALQEFESLL